ncbi:tetratricopeptide repeat protein [Flavobacterium sp.]|uniref:tetratricopeptide repeat protein n=1 Tax=Flavobacterium sp. TaxID=239 RepID=UPI0035288295
MKKIVILIILMLQTFMFAQDPILAFNYVESGEYEKAVTLLEEEYKINKQTIIFDKLLECYQQLENYEKALQLISDRRNFQKSPHLTIEEGYIYQLQNNTAEAEKKYNAVLAYIDENPTYAYTIGSNFEKKSLLEWAMTAYTKGQEINPELNFDFQIALLNGQMGNLPEMVNKLLDYAYAKPERSITVKNYFTSFLVNDATESFSNDLRKSLILRVQKTPDVFWNQFLSWYYVQQKDYGKAFVQEKAVFKRNPESLTDIISLGYMAIADEQYDAAKSVFQFVIENTTDKNTQFSADYFLIKMEIDESTPKDYATIKTNLETLLDKYNKNETSVDLYILAAHFNCFNLKNPAKATSLLENLLETSLSARQKAKIKLELADILLYNEKFNQAILYYAQVEDAMKNDEMAHEASMKMAKANYFKTDFEWALKQVKVLKQSASFLIANDALELFLLINDNSAEDSLQVALTAFSKADLKLYQNKTDNALQDFLTVLTTFKGDKIEEVALMRIGTIYEKQKEYSQAILYYEKLLNEHSESIYQDDALFKSAELYRKFLDNPEKAKTLYEKIIFNHQDSLYFTEARKQYRILRGDTTI